MSSKSNDRQVGGNHYAGVYQHWDYATDLNMRHLEGALTKYLARAGNKVGHSRAIDLGKALHYLEKLIEEYNDDNLLTLRQVHANHPPKHTPTYYVAQFVANMSGAAFTPRCVAVLVLLADWSCNEHLMLAENLLKAEHEEELRRPQPAEALDEVPYKASSTR